MDSKVINDGGFFFERKEREREIERVCGMCSKKK